MQLRIVDCKLSPAGENKNLTNTHNMAITSCTNQFVDRDFGFHISDQKYIWVLNLPYPENSKHSKHN